MTEITNLESYFEFLKSFEDKTVIFRGVDKRFKRLPTIVRSFCTCSLIDHGCNNLEDMDSWHHDWKAHKSDALNAQFKDFEKTLFDSFKRQARIYMATSPENDWEWLAYAQHYGLRTRLLDWSKNPLTALYFAISNQSNSSNVWVYVYDFGYLQDGHHHMIDLNKPPCNNPLDYPEQINRFIPPIIDTRMATQQSVFTIQADPFEIIEDENLRELVIKSSSKEDIRKQLHRIGVNQVSLFPDLEGLSKNLTWVWERFRGA